MKTTNSATSRPGGISVLNKILVWLDNNILTVLAAILIVVVPLYPKIPLADLIEGYIVRMRLEDILIAFAVLVWGIQFLRRKVSIPKGLIAKAIIAYLVIGVLSSLSAIFITHTVPLLREHLLKLGLHLFRRFEYFSLFFIAYSGIKNKKDLKLFIITGVVTLAAVVAYGFGQKYFYWPAFSTMNREFSKGLRLYLSPTSRVMSTFGGHYDYAAYLMMLLSDLVSAIWIIKNKWWALVLSLLSLAAYWSLILTASRTSYIGYVIGVTAIAAILERQFGFKWVFKRWFVTMSISFFIMLFFGDLSQRFFQIINSAEKIHSYLPWIETGVIEDKIFRVKDFGYRLQAIKNQVFSRPKPTPPPNSIALNDSELSQVAVPSDIPPSTEKPLPPDVTEQEEEDRLRQATASANTFVATPSAAIGGYSANALRYGLSIAIRLDALWPRAIAGLKKNPLLGSGYSTLTKSNNEEFTQAESTDNDYLRMLGETGVLGALSFLAIPFLLIYFSVKKYPQTKSIMSKVIYLGAVGAVIGLLVNATYIDVFESSKVAYTLWILAAIVVRTMEMEGKGEVKA